MLLAAMPPNAKPSIDSFEKRGRRPAAAGSRRGKRRRRGGTRRDSLRPSRTDPRGTALALVLALVVLLVGIMTASGTAAYSYDTARINASPLSAVAPTMAVAPAVQANICHRVEPVGADRSSFDRALVVAAEAEGALTAEARGGVYTLRDEAGQVVRTGRTNDLAARELAHARDPVLRDFESPRRSTTPTSTPSSAASNKSCTTAIRGLKSRTAGSTGSAGSARRIRTCRATCSRPGTSSNGWACDGEGELPRGRLVRGASS